MRKCRSAINKTRALPSRKFIIPVINDCLDCKIGHEKYEIFISVHSRFAQKRARFRVENPFRKDAPTGCFTVCSVFAAGKRITSRRYGTHQFVSQCVSKAVSDFNGDAVALIPEFKEFFTEKAPRKILTVDESSVTYYMFNRTKMKQYVFLTPANFFQINTAKKIVFLIHGWTESRNKTWYEDLKNAFLEKFDLNVIEVDYSQPASNRYPVAVLLSKSIGENRAAKYVLIK